MTRRNPGFLLAAAALATASSAFAAPNNWNGSTDASWNTAANWSLTTTPASGDTVTYAGTTNLTQTLDASFSVLGIAFTSTAGTQAYIINNGTGTNTLTLGTGGIDTTNFNTADSLTINANIVLNGAQSWKVTNGSTAASDLTVNGVISGTGALALGWTASGNGAGTIELTGLNTYTGVTTIRGGSNGSIVDANAFVKVTTIGNGGTNGNLGAASNAASNLVFGVNGQSAGQLNYVGAGENTDRLFTMSGHTAIVNNGTGALNFTNTGATVHASGTHNLIFAGSYTGAGNGFASLIVGGTTVIKDGVANWTFTGANTYTSSTTIKGGNSGTGANGILSVNTLANGGSASSIGQSTNAAANLVFGANGATSGTLNYIGTGSSTDRLFTLNGHGFITNNGTGALNFTNTGAVVHSVAGTNRNFTLGGANTGANTFALALNDNGTGKLNLTKADAGTWALTGTSAYSGGTVISAGTLVTGNTAALGSGSGAVNVNGTSVLQVGDGNVNTIALGSAANLAIANGATLKLGGFVSGALDGVGSVITLAGGGTYTFNASGKLDLGGVLNNLTEGSHTYNLISGGTGTDVTLSNITGFDGSVSLTSFTNGTLTFTAVPEPSTYGLIGAGALAGVVAVRRRRKRV